MISYLQTDPRWRDHTFSSAKLSLGKFGCLVTSLAMLDGRTPDVVADILTANGCFDANGLLYSTKAANVLGLKFDGKVTTKPPYTCVAETHYYAPGTPQHFFVLNADGSQRDPLGKNIKYPIVSYRLFHGKVDNPPIPPDNNGMTLPLYKDKRNGRIYFKFGNFVTYISDPAELAKFWPGVSPTEIDDIHSVGLPLENLMAEKDQLSAGVLASKEKITELEGQLQLMTNRVQTAEQALQECKDTPPIIKEVKVPVETLTEVELLRLLLQKIWKWIMNDHK